VIDLVGSLWGNRMGAEGAKHLSEALKANSTLQMLEYAAYRPILTVSSL
jgi:hypothetical protein